MALSRLRAGGPEVTLRYLQQMPSLLDRALDQQLRACLMKLDTDVSVSWAARRTACSSSGVNRTEIMATRRRCRDLDLLGAGCAAVRGTSESRS